MSQDTTRGKWDISWHWCTWYSHTEQNTVVDNGKEAQDTFGPLQLLGFQAQLLVAGHCHIGPVDHDLGASPGEQGRDRETFPGRSVTVLIKSERNKRKTVCGLFKTHQCTTLLHWVAFSFTFMTGEGNKIRNTHWLTKCVSVFSLK